MIEVYKLKLPTLKYRRLRGYMIEAYILKLPTLKYRRLRGDVIEAYKLISEIYDSTPPDLPP
jgi:hypothetical protein